MVRLELGDCLDVMRAMEPESVDAIVCDPPYGIGFVGREWDSAVPGVEWAAECLRVLKPGGHLVAFASTRTLHRLACAVEDAGFDIRDTVHWCYWSGFPKSLDVSKAIDKQDAVEEQQSRRYRFTEWVRSTGITARQIDEATGTQMGNHYTTHPTQPAVMTRKHLDAVRHLAGPVPSWVEAEADKRTVESANYAAREVVGTHTADMGGLDGQRLGVSGGAITAPATDAARKWSGWGTALKPAVESCALAQKPHDLTSLSAALAREIWRSACLLPSLARDAAARSESSHHEHVGATFASARWSAAERCSTPAALLALMDTSPSESGTDIYWSTACSWLRTLAATSDPASTFTTETASRLTTALQTLRSCQSPITPATIVEAATLTAGTESSAGDVAACFSVAGSILRRTLAPTAPARATSSPWAGDLAPAVEPAVLARKPLSGTVAANVLRHGTGALNIDGCRIAPGDVAWPGPGDDTSKQWARSWSDSDAPMAQRWAAGGRSGPQGDPSLGRWPANLYHCAKPSTAEREQGTEGLPKRGAGELVDRTEDSAGMDNPRAGAGRTSEGRANHHPTVKPLGLMRWLCRLVTPPGGVVLDPFMGSGTCGMAAVAEGFGYIGVELEPEYMAIANARIRYAATGLDVESPVAAVEAEQVGLFG